MFHKLKLTIGIFLLICTCLPLGSCEKKDLSLVNKAPSASQKVETDYLIPITEIDSILLLSMIWPIPFLIITRKKVKSTVKKRITRGFELLFSLFSAFVIYSFVFDLFYKPMIWGYVAFVLIDIYVLINLYEIIKSMLEFNKNKPSV